jgi:hypothetical protein
MQTVVFFQLMIFLRTFDPSFLVICFTFTNSPCHGAVFMKVNKKFKLMSNILKYISVNSVTVGDTYVM